MVNELYVRERRTHKNRENEEEWGKKKEEDTKNSRIWKNPRDTGALILVTHQCPSTVWAVLIFESGGGGGGGWEEGPDLGDITIAAAAECLSRSRSGPFPPLVGGGLDDRGACNEDIKGEAL